MKQNDPAPKLSNPPLRDPVSSQDPLVRPLVQSNLIGVLIADETRIIQANDFLLQQLGYGQDDLDERRLEWQALSPVEHHEQVRQSFDEARTRGFSGPTRREFIHRDGSRIPLLFALGAVDQRRALFVGYVLELSDRLPTEFEASHPHLGPLLGAFVDRSPVGMALIDRNVRYVWINEALAAFNLLTPAQHVGRTLREVLGPAADVIEPQVRQVLETGEALIGVEVVVDSPMSPGRPRRWLTNRYPVRAPDGQIIGIGIATTDLTEWKEIETEREKLVAQLQTVLQQMPSGVIIADAPTGRILFRNQQNRRIWGRDLSDLKELRDFWRFQGFDPDGNPLRPEDWPLARSIRTGEVIVAQEISILRADGTRGTVLAHSSPIRDSTGSITAAVATFTDISNRKQAERERIALLESERLAKQEALRERERLEQLQAVTAGLANALTPTEVAEVFIDLGLPATGARAGSVLLLDDDGETLELIASRGISPEWKERIQRIPLSLQAATTDAARTGRPIFIESRAEIELRYPLVAAIFTDSQAFAAIPLVVDRRLIGVFGFNFVSAGAIAKPERPLILTLAQKCAQALQRAHLYQAERDARAVAERATERTARLQSITAALSEALTQNQVAAAVVGQGVAALGAVAGAIGLIDGGDGSLRLLHSTGVPEHVLEMVNYSPNAGLAPANDVVRTGEPIWIGDRESFRRLYPAAAWSSEIGEALAAVPLRVGERIIGALGLRFSQARTFEPDDRAFVQTLAQQAAQAIERSHLYDAEREARAEAERATERSSRLHAVTAALSESLTQSEVAMVVVSEGLAALDAMAGAVLLTEPEGDALQVVQAIGYRSDRVGVGQRIPLNAPLVATEVARSGIPGWYSCRVDVEARYPGASSVVDGGEAFAAIPLVIQDRVIGILALAFSHTREFGQEDRNFILTLAHQCAEALERSRLYDAERAARAAAEKARERTALLQAVTAALSEALTQDEVADVIVEQGLAALGARSGAITVLTEDGQSLQMIESVGLGDRVNEAWSGPVSLTRHWPVTAAVRTRKPIWVTSRAQFEVEFARFTDLPIAEGSSWAAIPLVVHDNALGGLSLTFSQPVEFSAEDRAFVLTLAQQCAQALERSQLYEAERQARAAAEEAVRARERFLSIAAHELRTPLTTIKGYGQLIQRYLLSSNVELDRIVDGTGHLLAQVTRLETLITDLLDISRVQQDRLDLRRVTCDLTRLVGEVLRRFEDDPSRRPAHTIVFDAPQLVAGFWDPDRLDQVFTNLLANAFKYSPSGGEIRVSVRQIDNDAEVVVSDQGVGITETDREEMFKPFARGEAVRGRITGAGLGLYISFQIVQMHGGSLTVQSQPGVGSDFTVRLPLLPPLNPPSDAGPLGSAAM